MNRPSPKSRMIWTAALLLGVVLALVGAELPPETSFVQALPLWLTIVGTTVLLLTTIDGIIAKPVRAMTIKPVLAMALGGLITVALVTVPIALMCLPIDSLVPEADGLFVPSADSDPLSTLFWAWADQYLNLLPGVGGFWLFMKASDLIFPIEGEVPSPPNTAEQTEMPEHPSPSTSPSALARRFPDIAGQKLLAIEADEHYVRLHTDLGSEHVLYRFRDALKDVEDMKGLRVHRSWWVATDAIDAIEQTGNSFGLRLKSDLVVPVSQTYRREVERLLARA